MKRKIQSTDAVSAQRAHDRIARKLRETDPPEGDDDTQGDDKPYCDHLTRGRKQLRKGNFCSDCGARLRWDDAAVRATQVKGDEDKVSEQVSSSKALHRESNSPDCEYPSCFCRQCVAYRKEHARKNKRTESLRAATHVARKAK